MHRLRAETRLLRPLNKLLSVIMQDKPAAAVGQTRAKTNATTAVAPQAGGETGSARWLDAQWTCAH
jgi:hypothetical protein